MSLNKVEDLRNLRIASCENIAQFTGEITSDVMTLSIDCKEREPDFLMNDDFYIALQDKEHIFLVNIILSESINFYEIIKERINNIERSLIIQCSNPENTIVFVSQINKELIVLDLNSSAQPMDDFLNILKSKSSFGIELIIEALKLGWVGKFNDNSDNRRSLIDVSFHTHETFEMIFQVQCEEAKTNCTLLDYAVFHDDYLSTCLLSLHCWNLFAKNDEGLSTLEIAAKFASPIILTILLKVQLPLSGKRIELSTEAKGYLEPTNYYNENTPIFVAAEAGRIDNVDFFIRCGIDLSHQNSSEENVMSIAWENKHYELVLFLLKHDLEFPHTIDVDELLDKDEANELRWFIEERNKLHASIKEGNLVFVKEFITANKSKLFLNDKNQSAVLTAIEEKQWAVYALLKCNRISCRESEEQYIEDLNESEKERMRLALLQYFPQYENSHIFYLLSKTRSRTNIDDHWKTKIQEYYEELNENPDISSILKVIQYVDVLDIILDFEAESVAHLDPTANESFMGLTYSNEGRLYLGCKGEKSEILGTMAHEFTHLAMQTIYRNNCNPYASKDAYNEKIFNDIVEHIFRQLNDEDIDIECSGEINQNYNETIKIEGKDEIITRTFTAYPDEEEWPSELIVRVPHILAKYHDSEEDGRQKLQEQVPELLRYFDEIIIPNIETFIEENYLIRPRNIVRSLNDSTGEIRNFGNVGIQFNDTIDIEYVIENEHQVIVLSTDSIRTSLNCINIYQALEKIPAYASHDNYLIYNFDRYWIENVDQREEINNAFKSLACDLFIIELSDLKETDISICLKTLCNILTEMPTKKLIFVMYKNDVPQLKEIFRKQRKLKNKFYVDKYFEKNFTLNDLEPKSQEMLLNKEVTFQGKRIIFNQLVCEKIKDLIDSEILFKLIHNKDIVIGNKLINSSGYDNDYYIERIFELIVIDFKTFQENFPKEKCIISGAGEIYSKGNVFKVENDQVEELYEELCQKYPADSIHCLKYESQTYIWQQSYGSLFNLRRYIIKDRNLVSSREDDLLAYNSKVTIISDTAGMGKSTVLSSLAEKSKANNNELLWVIRINLNDYSRVLNDEQKHGFHSCNSAINFLSKTFLESQEQSRLKTDFENKLFLRILKYKCRTKIVLLFDGFDEICPDYETVVIKLLCALKTSRAKKILVTTRPNATALVENKLGAFAYTLQYFSEINQIDFLLKFWTKKLELDHNVHYKSRMVKYAQTLISKFSENISDEETTFTGIPLLTRMLAEIFQQNIKNQNEYQWQGLEEFLLANNDEPHLPRIFNLFTLYEQFIERKFYIHFEEKQRSDMTNVAIKQLREIAFKEFAERHSKLALRSLLNDKKQKELLDQEEMKEVDGWIKEIENGKGNQGIIDQIVDGKPHFVHLTFAEYFASLALVKNVFNETDVIFRCTDDIIRNASPVFLNSMIKQLTKKQKELDDLLEDKTLINLVIKKGYLNITKGLLEAGYVEYPKPDAQGKTPLHYASQYGHLKIVEYLLRHYNSLHENISNSELQEFVNKEDNAGHEARYYAYDNNHLDIVAKLSQVCDDHVSSLSPEAICDNDKLENQYKNLGEGGNSRLHQALKAESKFNIIKNLIDSKEDVNAKNNQGKTPLILAIEHMYKLHVIKYLIRHGADVNSVDNQGNTPLYFVTEPDQYFDKMKLLQEHGARINPKSITLHQSIRFNDLNNTRHLIYTGADVNQKDLEGRTPLHWASSSPDVLFVELLLQRGAIYNAKDNENKTPLDLCISHGHLRSKNKIEWLLRKLDALFENPTLLLNFELYEGDVGTFNTKAVFLNARNEQRQILLHIVAEKSITNNDLLQLFVGCDNYVEKIDINMLCYPRLVDATDFQGNTALHISAMKGCMHTVRWLLNNGAMFNVENNEGKTPDQFANSEVISTFELTQGLFDDIKNNKISCKFEYIEVKDENQRTLLHWAVISRNSSNVRSLILSGATVNMADKDGKTPLQLAAENDDMEIVKMLLWRGAIYFVPKIELGCITNRTINLLKAIDKLFENAQCGDFGSFVEDLQTIRKEFYQKISYFINCCDAEGCTLLHYAVEWKSFNIVQFLLQNGAIYNVRNNYGETPEETATVDDIKHLLDSVSNMFSRRKDIKPSELDELSEKYGLSTISNVRNREGSTLLSEVICENNLNIAKYLVERGCEFGTEDFHGQTVFDYVAKKDSSSNKHIAEKIVAGLKQEISDNNGNNSIF